MQNRILEPTGLAKLGNTHRLPGMGPGLARHKGADRILDGSGTKSNRLSGPNPDRWRVTRTHCKH